MIDLVDWSFFAGVLAVKLATGWIAVIADNDYLTGAAFRSATLSALLVAGVIPISRMVIAEANNVAAAACVVSAFVTSFYDAGERVKPTVMRGRHAGQSAYEMTSRINDRLFYIKVLLIELEEPDEHMLLISAHPSH